MTTWRIYARLLPYLRSYRWPLAAYLALTMAAAGFELLTPWPMKIIVDSVIGRQPLPWGVREVAGGIAGSRTTQLVGLVLAVVVLKLWLSALRVLTARISIRVRQGVVLGVKSDLFHRLQRQSLNFYDSRRTGDLIYRVNSDVWGVDEVILTAMPLLVAAITLVGMLAVVAALNWQLALLSLVITPIFYSTYGLYSRHFDKRVDAIQRLEGESMSIAHEVLSALRVVKAFTREEYEQQRFEERGRAAATARVGLTDQQVRYSIAVSLITTAGTALVLGAGAFQVLRGGLTLGELLVVLAYVASLYGPLESISSAATYMHAYTAKIRRVIEILDGEPEVRDHAGAMAVSRVRGRITFDGVGFGFPGRSEVLRDISFEVNAGEVVAIVGPTGAGKTTLVSLVPRFYDPTVGRILLDDRDIREIKLRSLREQIRMVLQEPILFMGSIRENIAYGRPDAAFEDIVTAATVAGAHEFVEQLPEGYETRVGERGVTLSGGERQRIAIARGLLKEAPVLILDEPTASVDYRTEAGILEAMERVTRGRTTLIVAHRISTIRSADKIVVLREGAIAEMGRHEELWAARGLYRELYEKGMAAAPRDARTGEVVAEVREA
jgi:ATP-binding cassette subfamily B protein/subfamily B ATP-binding cassette protein MsbA